MTSLREHSERRLGAVAVLILLIGCLLVLRPFVSALLWSVVLCVATWPLYRRLVRWFRDHRTLAASVMMLAMILVLLLPFGIAGVTLAENINDFTGSARQWIERGPPSPPEWLGKVPIVGPQAVDKWQTLAHDSAKLWAELLRFVEPVSAWLLKTGLGLGSGLIELALSIFIAFFLFRDGASLSARLSTAVDMIGGDRGRHLLTVAVNTVRGVVYGLIGTSLIQSIVAAVGFLIAGLPDIGLLALLTFFSSVVPVVGTALVWLPAAFWLFHNASVGWGIFMLVWGVGVSSLDNFVKPWLISQGSEMPFLLIFFGVIGGALTFGFIGVFLGPTLLAVGFRIFEEWNPVRPIEAAAETKLEEVSP